MDASFAFWFPVVISLLGLILAFVVGFATLVGYVRDHPLTQSLEDILGALRAARYDIVDILNVVGVILKLLKDPSEVWRLSEIAETVRDYADAVVTVLTPPGERITQLQLAKSSSPRLKVQGLNIPPMTIGVYRALAEALARERTKANSSSFQELD